MINLLIILAFIVYAVGNGLRARHKASQNLREYFLAGKTVEGWGAGLSMAATQFAADTPLLVTGLIATGGIFLLWRLWIYGLAFLLMAFVTTAAAVGITFFTPSTSRRVLLSFYKRVRPLGFWSKTASAFGDRPAAPREALWRRLHSLTLTALSLFLLLVGLGRLMIPPPGGSVLVTWSCALAGLALIPFWWRDAVVRDELVVNRRAEEPTPAPESTALEGPA